MTLKENLKALEERIAAIDYEISVNPDYVRPDDYYSCVRLAQSIREELKGA